MGYCANGSGYITFKRRLTDDEMISVENILQKACFCFDFSYSLGGSADSIEESCVDVWYDTKYRSEEIESAVREIATATPVKEGCIEFVGDDYTHWRFLYDPGDNDWVNQTGYVVYDS